MVRYDQFQFDRLLLGFDDVFASADKGQNWTNISNGGVGSGPCAVLKAAPGGEGAPLARVRTHARRVSGDEADAAKRRAGSRSRGPRAYGVKGRRARGAGEAGFREVSQNYI